MKSDEYEQQDGLGPAALVRPREATPEEVLDAALSAVDADNPPLNAVVARFGDEATLSRLAGELEQERVWAARRPPR